VSIDMPTRPISPLGQRIVGIEADLGRQVEGDVEAGLAVGDQVLEALVGVGRITEAGVLAHGPRLLAVHLAVDAAGEGILAGLADHCHAAAGLDVGCGIQRLDLDAGLVDDFLHFGFLRAFISHCSGCTRRSRRVLNPKGKFP
jgi:hypothetical protein